MQRSKPVITLIAKVFIMTKFLDKRNAAELLGVSVRTVDSLRKKGLPFSCIGGQVRFLESEIFDWVKAQQPQTASAISTNAEGGSNDGKAE